MKLYALITVSAVALAVAACTPKAPPARATLDCPIREGDLTRKSVGADGKSCAYVTSSGDEVLLQLVSVQSSVDAALQAVETGLLAGRIEKADEADKSVDNGKSDKVADEVRAEVREAVKDAVKDAKDAGVTIEMGGNRGVIVDDNGDTHVNLPGIHIEANEKNETAKVKVGPLTVDAGGDTATVRMRRDVRLKGEALSRQKRGLRAMFIYTGKDLPDGYRFVGYEAGGPKTGPLAIATVKSKSDSPDDGELYPDVKRLVRMNAGV